MRLPARDTPRRTHHAERITLSSHPSLRGTTGRDAGVAAEYRAPSVLQRPIFGRHVDHHRIVRRHADEAGAWWAAVALDPAHREAELVATEDGNRRLGGDAPGAAPARRQAPLPALVGGAHAALVEHRGVVGHAEQP